MQNSLERNLEHETAVLKVQYDSVVREMVRSCTAALCIFFLARPLSNALLFCQLSLPRPQREKSDLDPNSLLSPIVKKIVRLRPGMSSPGITVTSKPRQLAHPGDAGVMSPISLPPSKQLPIPPPFSLPAASTPFSVGTPSLPESPQPCLLSKQIQVPRKNATPQPRDRIMTRSRTSRKLF